MRLERHASYRGRTTPEITWRVWNDTETAFTPFKRKRDALAYIAASEGEE